LLLKSLSLNVNDNYFCFVGVDFSGSTLNKFELIIQGKFDVTYELVLVYLIVSKKVTNY